MLSFELPKSTAKIRWRTYLCIRTKHELCGVETEVHLRILQIRDKDFFKSFRLIWGFDLFDNTVPLFIIIFPSMYDGYDGPEFLEKLFWDLQYIIRFLFILQLNVLLMNSP